MQMKRLLSFILLIFLCIAVQAQERTITGTVTGSDDKQPLPGVNVVVKGTMIGVVSDISGKFSIKVTNADAVLVFSFVGYKPQEIPAGNLTSLNVELTPDFVKLSEVVVVGYGIQQKAVVTGAIAQVSSDDIKETNSAVATQAMQGMTAGVVIQSNSGQPGDNVSVAIRGYTNYMNSDPLYVVDGLALPSGASLDYLNPTDIESVNVLKDAASCAIYGTRGSNGVILIQTKSAKSGQKFSVTYEGYYGAQNPSRELDVTNSKQYMMLINEASANDGGLPIYNATQMDTLSRVNTDWQKQMFNLNAVKQSHDLTFQGSDENSSYYSSFSYYDQQGIVAKGKSGYDRFTFHINASRKFGALTLGTNLSLADIVTEGISSNSNTSNSSLAQALNMPELVPVKNSDGSWATPTQYGIGLQEISNPVALLSYLNSVTLTRKCVGGITADLDLGKWFDVLKGLSLKTVETMEYTNVYNRSFTPQYDLDPTHISPLNSVGEEIDIYQKYSTSLTANYVKSFAKHNLTLLAGWETWQEQQDQLGGGANTMIFNGLGNAYLDNTLNPSSETSYGAMWLHTLESYFGRLNYDYDGKYILTAIVRRDASSRFGSEYQWGTFPSVSVAYNISKENFFQPLSHIINMAKIRIGYGENGVEPQGNFLYTALMSTYGQNYFFGGAKSGGAGNALNTQTLYPGASPTGFSTPSLHWTSTDQFDVGLDLGLLQNSVNFTFDYYLKTTNGLPVPVPAMYDAGQLNGGPTENAMDIQNQGVEFSVTYRTKISDFTLDATVNCAYNKGTVTSLASNSNGIIGGSGAFSQSQFVKFEKGQPLAEFYGLKTAGLFQSWADVNSYVNSTGGLIQPNAHPGDIKFVDVNKLGKISSSDWVPLGSPIPDFTAGLNVKLGWKGFDLTMLWYTALGAKDFSASYRYDLGQANFRSDALGRWTGAGTSNYYPRMSLSDPNENWANVSDRDVQSANYTRLKTLTLGYSLPKSVSEFLKVQNVRFFVTGENLLTITPYKGYEPEIGGTPDVNGSTLFSKGIDYGDYPQARTVLGGIAIKFN